MHLTEEFLNSFKASEQIENLAIYMLEHDFTGTIALKKEYMIPLQKQAENYKYHDPAAYKQYIQAYQAVLSDLIYFPVAASNLNKKATVSFENSWMFERNYGGSRGHEGTDVMPNIKKNNYYPIVSMTDGVVDKIGWLEKGGYRIGIRSPHGGYFYYAHLSSYTEEFQIGDRVQAGQMLGYMGDTGYGPEGTTGMFDTHLHLGIYIKTAHYEELSVNPYWILKYLEDEQIYYNF